MRKIKKGLVFMALIGTICCSFAACGTTKPNNGLAEEDLENMSDEELEERIENAFVEIDAAEAKATGEAVTSVSQIPKKVLEQMDSCSQEEMKRFYKDECRCKGGEIVMSMDYMHTDYDSCKLVGAAIATEPYNYGSGHNKNVVALTYEMKYSSQGEEVTTYVLVFFYNMTDEDKEITRDHTNVYTSDYTEGYTRVGDHDYWGFASFDEIDTFMHEFFEISGDYNFEEL